MQHDDFQLIDIDAKVNQKEVAASPDNLDCKMEDEEQDFSLKECFPQELKEAA